MPPLAHWDDVEGRRRESGHIVATWRDLGAAAGSVTVGVQLVAIDPGRWSTPAHVEGGEEEIFYVLRGSGISWQWDGEDEAAYEVREGDCLVHVALEQAHTLRAGPEGLRVLAFGERALMGATFLPRAGVSWLGATWVLAGGEENHPWKREAAAGEPEVGELLERPPAIVNVADTPVLREWSRDTVGSVWRDLARAAGSERTGLRHVIVSPGKLDCPPHCHSSEEEIFVVLDGNGVCILGEDEHPVRAGHVLARPAGTRVAHAFRAGEQGLTLLAYGTRDPNDVAYYPRSQKIYWRGVGVIGRIEQLDYWDGES